MLRRAADAARRDRHARRFDAAASPGDSSCCDLLRRMRNQAHRRDSVRCDASVHRRRLSPNRGRDRFGRHLNACPRRVHRDPLPALRQRVRLPDLRVSFYEGARHRRRHRDLPADDPRCARPAVRPRMLANLLRSDFQPWHVPGAGDRRRRVRLLRRDESDRMGSQLSRADPLHRDRRGDRRDGAHPGDPESDQRRGSGAASMATSCGRCAR